MENLENKNLNILIVDDDEFSIFLSEALFKEHFNITGVRNGHDALEAVENNEFDLVLMDINLGDLNMDGIRTMRMMRNRRKSRALKIVAITAFANSKEFYVNHGFNDLFVKPLLEESHVKKIAELCAKRKSIAN
jgi:CheY-like chemotaxis protein